MLKVLVNLYAVELVLVCVPGVHDLVSRVGQRQPRHIGPQALPGELRTLGRSFRGRCRGGKHQVALGKEAP